MFLTIMTCNFYTAAVNVISIIMYASTKSCLCYRSDVFEEFQSSNSLLSDISRLSVDNDVSMFSMFTTSCMP